MFFNLKKEAPSSSDVKDYNSVLHNEKGKPLESTDGTSSKVEEWKLLMKKANDQVRISNLASSTLRSKLNNADNRIDNLNDEIITLKEKINRYEKQQHQHHHHDQQKQATEAVEEEEEEEAVVLEEKEQEKEQKQEQEYDNDDDDDSKEKRIAGLTLIAKLISKMKSIHNKNNTQYDYDDGRRIQQISTSTPSAVSRHSRRFYVHNNHNRNRSTVRGMANAMRASVDIGKPVFGMKFISNRPRY